MPAISAGQLPTRRAASLRGTPPCRRWTAVDPFFFVLPLCHLCHGACPHARVLAAQAGRASPRPLRRGGRWHRMKCDAGAAVCRRTRDDGLTRGARLIACAYVAGICAARRRCSWERVLPADAAWPCRLRGHHSRMRVRRRGGEPPTARLTPKL